MTSVVWKSGWFIAHAWIADQANYFLEAAEDGAKPEGRTSNCAAALVFGSFCLEAFANSAGRVWIPHWDLLEKKLSPQDKIKIISTALGLNADFSKAPYQCVNALFKYRNWLAHGKDERVQEKIKVAEDKKANAIWGAPKHEQQKLLVPSVVRKYLTQADELIDLIEKKSRRKRRTISMIQIWTAGTSSKTKRVAS
jgi:hypothetical protein